MKKGGENSKELINEQGVKSQVPYIGLLKKGSTCIVVLKAGSGKTISASDLVSQAKVLDVFKERKETGRRRGLRERGEKTAFLPKGLTRGVPGEEIKKKQHPVGGGEKKGDLLTPTHASNKRKNASKGRRWPVSPEGKKKI